MSKLQFEYRMTLNYSQPISECHYTLKCLPPDTDMQQISQLQISITPDHDYQRGSDSFGNLTIYDNLYFPHSSFTLHITGIAETWLAVSQRNNGYASVFRYPHRLNQAGSELKAYFHSLAVPSGSDYDKALYLMRCLHRDFEYRTGTTSMDTSAEQAWQQGCGVCQDYAHILIALCHMAGIAARYVTGMMIGEGQTHAWVEILSADHWYALDPTNNCIAADTYIKIGHGRDAADCMINKGVVKGCVQQEQIVTVLVKELS